jgi:hypothetical protein
VAFVPLPTPGAVERYPAGSVLLNLANAGLSEFLPYFDQTTGPAAVIKQLSVAHTVKKEQEDYAEWVVDALAWLRHTRAGKPAKGGWGKGADASFGQFDKLTTIVQPGLNLKDSSKFVVNRVWLRRVALALYADLYEPWPWSLANLPDWQQAVLLCRNEAASPDYSRDFVAKARFPKRIADAAGAAQRGEAVNFTSCECAPASSEDERREARGRRACSRRSRE